HCGPQYGVGGSRSDSAAPHPDDADRMVLAIEADGTSYRQSGSVRDRDRLRSEHLQRLGWRFHRIWSTNWFRDPQSEVAKLQQAYDDAGSATIPAGPKPAPEAETPPPEPVAETTLPQSEAPPDTAQPRPEAPPDLARPQPETTPETAKPPLETARPPGQTQIAQPEVRRPPALPAG